MIPMSIGGNTYSSEGQYDIADVQIYNFKTGQWKQGQVMNYCYYYYYYYFHY